jgi:hypothetical protein
MLQDASFELIAAKVFELDDVIVEKEWTGDGKAVWTLPIASTVAGTGSVVLSFVLLELKKDWGTLGPLDGSIDAILAFLGLLDEWKQNCFKISVPSTWWGLHFRLSPQQDVVLLFAVCWSEILAVDCGWWFLFTSPPEEALGKKDAIYNENDFIKQNHWQYSNKFK